MVQNEIDNYLPTCFFNTVYNEFSKKTQKVIRFPLFINEIPMVISLTGIRKSIRRIIKSYDIIKE